jgi:hypothetical protein
MKVVINDVEFQYCTIPFTKHLKRNPRKATVLNTLSILHTLKSQGFAERSKIFSQYLNYLFIY